MNGRTEEDNSNYFGTTAEGQVFILDNEYYPEENLLDSDIFSSWPEEMDLNVAQESVSMTPEPVGEKIPVKNSNTSYREPNHRRVKLDSDLQEQWNAISDNLTEQEKKQETKRIYSAQYKRNSKRQEKLSPSRPLIEKYLGPDVWSVTNSSTMVEKEPEENKSTATIDPENELLVRVHIQPMPKQKRSEYEENPDLGPVKKRRKLDPDLQQRMDDLPADLPTTQLKIEKRKITNAQEGRNKRINHKEKREETERRLNKLEEEHLEIKSCIKKMKNESDEFNKTIEELKARVYAKQSSPTLFRIHSDLNVNAHPLNRVGFKT